MRVAAAAAPRSLGQDRVTLRQRVHGHGVHLLGRARVVVGQHLQGDLNKGGTHCFAIFFFFLQLIIYYITCCN